MTTYNGNALSGNEAFAAGDIINFDYSGAVKSIKLPAATIKLECWGAQGGTYSSYAGKGGYSYGNIALSLQTFCYVAVGGQSGSAATGGYNGGGGTNNYGGSGGGGSDIRIVQNSLYARCIVAGGGGGGGYSSTAGGYGGGTSGGQGGNGSATGGYGGTQTAAGINNTAGSFGTANKNTSNGGGGGGGWYGGASGWSSGTDTGGGGGSGYVYTINSAASYPADCLLNSSYYLSNAATVAGNISFIQPEGTTAAGRAGNGYVRITIIELAPTVPPMPTDFRQIGSDYFSIRLAWSGVECNGYRLYRNGTLIATLAASSTSCTDDGVNPNSSYTYTLNAYNENGDSKAATVTATSQNGWAVRVFEIQSASITPNPANINTAISIAAKVFEDVKILEPQYFYSGEINSEEV